jgi:hypothetical protein
MAVGSFLFLKEQLKGIIIICLLGEEVVTEDFDDTRVRLPEPLHDLPVPELGFLLVAECLVFLALRVEGGLGDLRSNGQQLSRPFFFLKVFGDFVVPNVAVVSRTSELNRVVPASMTKVQPALAIAVTISVLASFQSR